MNTNFASFNVVTFNTFTVKDSEGIIAKELTQISTDNVKNTFTSNLVRKRSSKMLSKFRRRNQHLQKTMLTKLENPVMVVAPANGTFHFR